MIDSPVVEFQDPWQVGGREIFGGGESFPQFPKSLHWYLGFFLPQSSAAPAAYAATSGVCPAFKISHAIMSICSYHTISFENILLIV